MSLTLLPAIDLRGGRAVRLLQGDYTRETVYADDPVAVAEQFAAAGANWLHLIDLDGARDGLMANATWIAKIAQLGLQQVELGGGLRSDDDVARAVEEWGVARVVLGTAAVENPDWAAAAIARWPGRVAVGLDARGEAVATRGWRADGGRSLTEMLHWCNEVQPAALIFTEIARDGAMQGPDLDALARVLAMAQVPVIASGGVQRLDDLAAIAALADRGPLAGVIVGRAIYEGKLDVRAGIELLATAAAGSR